MAGIQAVDVEESKCDVQRISSRTGMPRFRLSYQRPKDHRDQRRRDRLQARGGMAAAIALYWEAFAQETGALYVPAKWASSTSLGKVVSQVGCWTLTMQARWPGEQPMGTRIIAPVKLASPFRMRLRPFGLVDQLREYVGLRGMPTGDSLFDANFVSRSSRPDLLPAILARGQIRSIYRRLADVTLIVRGAVAPNVARLELTRSDLVASSESIMEVYTLVVQVLDALVKLGVAMSGEVPMD